MKSHLLPRFYMAPRRRGVGVSPPCIEHRSQVGKSVECTAKKLLDRISIIRLPIASVWPCAQFHDMPRIAIAIEFVPGHVAHSLVVLRHRPKGMAYISHFLPQLGFVCRVSWSVLEASWAGLDRRAFWNPGGGLLATSWPCYDGPIRSSSKS